jgi:3-deoxy-manno-octulosonate cytidylyltransferase (CMP-KDO synthetase)
MKRLVKNEKAKRKNKMQTSNRINFLGIIPARYQSTRFPGKPLVKIDGKTMIQRVWENATLAMGQVVVATDNEKIKTEVENFGGKVIMTSPEHPSGTDRCAEAVDLFEEATNQSIDVVLNIQGDEPFLDPEQIKELMAAYEDPATKIATLIKKLNENDDIFDPNEPKVVIDKNNFALYFSRSPVPYLRNIDKNEWIRHTDYYKHIGMYAFKRDTLKFIAGLNKTSLESAESLEQLRWLENGLQIKCLETKIDSLSVDSVEDLKRMKAVGLLKKYVLPE